MYEFRLVTSFFPVLVEIQIYYTICGVIITDSIKQDDGIQHGRRKTCSKGFFQCLLFTEFFYCYFAISLVTVCFTITCVLLILRVNKSYSIKT